MERIEAAIESFPGLFDELAEVKRVKARIDAAEAANLSAALAGADTTETQAELDAALDEAFANEDGFWLIALLHLTSNVAIPGGPIHGDIVH